MEVAATLFAILGVCIFVLWLITVEDDRDPFTCRDCGAPVAQGNWYCDDCYDARAW
jgi:hypothetical protein